MLENFHISIDVLIQSKTPESSLREEVPAQVPVPRAQQGDAGGAQVQLPLRQRRVRQLPAVAEVEGEVLQRQGAQVEEEDGVRARDILPQGLPTQQLRVGGGKNESEGKRVARW